MDNDALQDAVKSDLRTIENLKFGILSANDLYGSMGGFILKMALLLTFINICLQVGLHSIGLYYPTLTLGGVLFMLLITLAGSAFVTIFLSPFILFSRLVKGRLKLEAFIKQKWVQACLLYLLIYSVIYFAIIIFERPGNLYSFQKERYDTEGWSAFYLAVAEQASLIGSLILTQVIVGIEINRLGIGIAFDVVKTFVARIRNTSIAESSALDGSDS